MQDFINSILNANRRNRSLSQMTLGKFISELEKLPQEKEIEKICNPHSYRGYYADLAFEKEYGTRTIASLVEQLKTECLGKTFTGWKGGDFEMNEDAPLWIAEQGSCGEKITGIHFFNLATTQGLYGVLTKEDD